MTNVEYERAWDKTNFLGRDREIRLLKIHYETETEKKGCWFFERDETEMRLSDFFMSETRARQDITQNSVRDRDETESLGVFFLRDRDKN